MLPSLPTIMAIQTRNEIIPIIIRYIGRNILVFSLPSTNAKVPYSVEGTISNDEDLHIIHELLDSMVIPFNKEEIENMRYNQDKVPDPRSAQQEAIIVEHPIVGTGNRFKENTEVVKRHAGRPKGAFAKKNKENTEQIVKRAVGRPKGKYYKKVYIEKEEYIDFNEPFHHHFTQNIFLDKYVLFQMSKEEKRMKAEELYTRANQMFKPDINNSEIITAALKMFDQAQRITLDLYPGYFHRIVLPGRSSREISKIDPEAYIMNPKQFYRFIVRRKLFARLFNENIITGRIKGIRYPQRSECAKNRVRNSVGIFV